MTCYGIDVFLDLYVFYQLEKGMIIDVFIIKNHYAYMHLLYWVVSDCVFVLRGFGVVIRMLGMTVTADECKTL